MLVELVKVQTRDGVRLDGALSPASTSSAETLVILLHGVGGNFYGSRMMAELVIAITGTAVSYTHLTLPTNREV